MPTMQAVVSAYTPLQQSGNEWRGACPECSQDAHAFAQSKPVQGVDV